MFDDDEKNIRRPVSEQKAKELLDHLAEVGILNVKNEKYREQEYKDCISSFCPENWVKSAIRHCIAEQNEEAA